MVGDDRWWPMVIDGDQWWSMMINDDRWWSMMIDDDWWWLMMIDDGQWWLMMINDDRWWLMMIDDDHWWSIMINDDRWWLIMIENKPEQPQIGHFSKNQWYNDEKSLVYTVFHAEFEFGIGFIDFSPPRSNFSNFLKINFLYNFSIPGTPGANFWGFPPPAAINRLRALASQGAKWMKI